jgi:DNA topoisomerase-3
MILYIVEKPSQVKALAGALKEAGIYIKDVTIKPLVGHILALKEFKELNEDFKKKSWNELVRLNRVPFFPNNPYSIELKKLKNKKVFDEVKGAIKEADKIILAPDPDNEGVTLAMEVIEKCNALDKVIGMINMSKLDTYSLSKEVKTINKIPFKNMYAAGQSRALFDMLFGFNATIMATEYLNKGNNLLNIGAVKLPTISMVVRRDEEFEKHKKIPYYVVKAKAKAKDKVFDISFSIRDKDKIETKEMADKLVSVVKENNKFKVYEFKEENKKETPPKPYSLTDLQNEANKKFKFTAKKVLELAQSLYENHKVESYPRTDNNYYSEGEYKEAGNILSSLSSVEQYGKFISKLDLNNLLKRSIFNDDKVTAHTALAPTIQAKLENLKKLNENEKKIFHLVATRYIIQFYPDYEYLGIKGKANYKNIIAEFNEKLPTKAGFKEVTGEYKEKERTIPHLDNEDEIEILTDTIEVKEEFTKPKPRFTEATLLKAMEKVYNFFDDEKIKEVLKEAGIGTPATRAAILEDLKKPDKSGEAYFKIEKNKIISTQKARDLIHSLPDDITSPIVRATFEEKLNLIVDNKFSKDDFYKEAKEYIIKACEDIKNRGKLRENNTAAKKTGLKCPLCGAEIVEKAKTFMCENGKYNPKTKKVEGCNFFIVKNGKFISFDTDKLKDLLEGKVVENDKIKVVLDTTNPYFTKGEFKQNNKTNSNSDEVTETPKTYRLGDKYIFKTFRNKKITLNQAKKILNGDKVILSLKSKEGKPYKMNVWYSENGKFESEFIKEHKK